MRKCPYCNWQSWQAGESHRCQMMRPKPPLVPTESEAFCSICHRENWCLSVKSSWIDKDMCISGHQYICIPCMESGRWRNGC